jgi:hypothetical protein
LVHFSNNRFAIDLHEPPPKAKARRAIGSQLQRCAVNVNYSQAPKKTRSYLENSDDVDGGGDKEVFSCALLDCVRYFHNPRAELVPAARDGCARSSNSGAFDTGGE